jgi:C-terminal binding protein
VLPVEPPVEPVPELLRLYRAREPWLEAASSSPRTPPG